MSNRNEKVFGDSGKTVVSNKERSQTCVDPNPEYCAGQGYKSQPSSLDDIKKDNAPNSDLPTTASGQKGIRDLPSVVSLVDSKGLSSVLPQMMTQFSSVKNSVSGVSQGARKQVLEDAFTEALYVLVNKYNYEMVIVAFDEALTTGDIRFFDPDHLEVLKNSLANLITTVTYHGINEILPVRTYHETPEAEDVVVLDGQLVTVVPDLYVQQYYMFEEDPFPSFIKWLSRDGSRFVYTKRTGFYYESASEEIFSNNVTAFVDGLDPHIRDNTLRVRIIDELLTARERVTEARTIDKSLGQNANQNMAGLLPQILGYIAPIINRQKTTQLPPSVLNKGSISTSLDSYSRNMATLKGDIKPKLKNAIQGRTPVNNLMSGSGFSLGQISSMFNVSQSTKSTIDTTGSTNNNISEGLVNPRLVSQISEESPALMSTINVARIISR